LRSNVNEPLKEEGRTAGASGGNRLRHALVASEVALALVVLSVAMGEALFRGVTTGSPSGSLPIGGGFRG